MDAATKRALGFVYGQIRNVEDLGEFLAAIEAGKNIVGHGDLLYSNSMAVTTLPQASSPAKGIAVPGGRRADYPAIGTTGAAAGHCAAIRAGIAYQ